MPLEKIIRSILGAKKEFLLCKWHKVYTEISPKCGYPCGEFASLQLHSALRSLTCDHSESTTTKYAFAVIDVRPFE